MSTTTELHKAQVRIRELEGAIKVHRDAMTTTIRLLSDHGSASLSAVDRELYEVIENA